MNLSINRCPVHQNFWSVSIEDEDGGQRVTPSKCCGQWETVRSWALSSDDWKELAQLAQQASGEALSALDARTTADVDARLRQLAIHGAETIHHRAQGEGTIPTHTGTVGNCPHPDCVLARELGRSARTTPAEKE